MLPPKTRRQILTKLASDPAEVDLILDTDLRKRSLRAAHDAESGGGGSGGR